MKMEPKKILRSVYYFDHFEIDGTVFDGYYYHDESGKFTAGNSHMVQITDLKAPAKDGSGEEVSFDGCYMVNNLGKLSASPQVRYMDELVVDKTTYNGCIILMNMEKWSQIQVSIIWK